MANFDYKKFLKENKSTFHSTLTEGQFSWMTQDTNQQIGSEDENTLPFVYMFDNKGNKWLEKNYEGYGEFGGKDYYELLAQMNGMANPDRSEGISLAFSGKKGILYPALVVNPNFDWKNHDFTQEAENDPNQSWYAGEEDEDDDYIMGDRDDEYLQEAELPSLELDQVQNIAQQVADEFTKYENELDLKFSITPDSVEASPKGAGFDLDIAAGPNTPGDEWKDEKGFGIENYLGKFAGGSYIIKSEDGQHKIYNAATGNSYIGYVTPQGEVVFEYEKSMNEAEEAPKSNKMKKSELKELIKSSIMEYERDVDYTDETSGYDFLAEIDAILAEAEGDEEVAVDDTEVAVDGEENIDVDTTAEVDPNVKAVQDALTQAQAAAQKLGDKKLTDQIGNTITFFTRAHVVDKGAVAEGEDKELEEGVWSFLPARVPEFVKAVEDLKDEYHGVVGDDDIFDHLDGAIRRAEELKATYSKDEMEEGKKEYYKDAEADDAEHIKALEKDMKDDKESSMKIKEVVFPMWQRINK